MPFRKLRIKNPVIFISVVGAVLILALLVYWSLRPAAPVVEATSSPVVTTAPAQPASVPAAPKGDKATLVLELFNPSDLALDAQLNATTISEQIEQLMATSYILSNCHLLSAKDYRDNFRALIIYAERTKFAADATDAEAKVRALAKSASASYGLLYSRTNCRDPKLPGIAEQLLAWQKTYLPE